MGPPAALFLHHWTRRKQRPPASLQTTGSEGPLRPSDLLPWKGGKRELGMGWGSGAMGGRGRWTLAAGVAGGGRKVAPAMAVGGDVSRNPKRRRTREGWIEMREKGDSVRRPGQF